MDNRPDTLVYACSGCSAAAQTANALALRLDHRGLAEMSCIAGVGGDIKPLVKLARSGRPIMVIDGCPLQCARACLARHQVVPDIHIDLSRHGVVKALHQAVQPREVDRIWYELLIPTITRII